MQRPTRHSRKARLRASSSRISRPDQPSASDAAAVSLKATNAGPGPGFFSNARDFVVNNPTFYNVREDPDNVTFGRAHSMDHLYQLIAEYHTAMRALAERAVEGSEYDSSARDPPPLCHPGTRVQLIDKVSTWFHNKGRQKALLWLSGPAGVGKSAVIQTFSESLAESRFLGAALFFSRTNNRKDPQRIVTTVAFQLATRIPAYRACIAEQIALDPSLLKKGIKEQFRIFLVEPFGNKEIGKGGGPWGVLLDGLDECEGVDQQCQIVRLVSEFVLDFPHAPLVWVVASRPEPHLVATFADETVAPSHWSEYIPVNSTEACQDVERYLNASFEAMRKRFPHIPSNWPSEAQFLMLTNGALGLFVFARTAVRFMEDPDHADPISRLNLIIAVIHRASVIVTSDHPFALLDALYMEILTSVPPPLWHTTKRILGFVICTQSNSTHDGLSYPLKSRSLIGLSIILDLTPSVVYSSLHKLHSVLEIPPSESAHRSEILIFHASFAEYLTDPTRSKDFFIDRGETVDEITRCLHKLYVEKPWDTKWARYTSQSSGPLGSRFFRGVRRDIEVNLYYAVTGDRRSVRGMGPFNSQKDLSECLDLLSQINAGDFYRNNVFEICFTSWVFKLWSMFRKELEHRRLCKEVALGDLKVDYLDLGRNKPVGIFHIYGTGHSMERLSPDSPHALRKFIDELRSLQLDYPDKRTLICGSTPEKRNALVYLKCGGIEMRGDNEYKYYCIPYPY